MLKFLNVITYIDESSNEKRIDLQTSSTPNTVPLRDSNGLFKVGDPNSSLDASNVTNKGWANSNFLFLSSPDGSQELTSSQEDRARTNINAAKALDDGWDYVVKDNDNYLTGHLYVSYTVGSSLGDNNIINKGYMGTQFGTVQAHISSFDNFGSDDSVSGQYVSGFGYNNTTGKVIINRKTVPGMVKLDNTTQSVGGVKTFTNTLKSDNIPSSSKDVVNRKYISDMVDSILNGTLMKLAFNAPTTEQTYIKDVYALAAAGDKVIVDWGDYSSRNYYTVQASGSQSVTHSYESSGDKKAYVMNVTNIRNEAFHDCSDLTSVTIPSSVTNIGINAFRACRGLANIEIPKGVTNMGNSSFRDCSHLEILTFEQGSQLATIGNSAFAGCSSLDNVTIPDAVTSIGYGVFNGDKNLKTLKIGNGISTIPNNPSYPQRGLLYDCGSLTTLTIPFVGKDKNAQDASPDALFGTIFGTESYTGGVATDQYYTSQNYNTYYIPSSLTTVNVMGGDVLYGAFRNCSNLINVVLNSNMTKIENTAFLGCDSLSGIIIPPSITRIGSSAFGNETRGYCPCVSTTEDGIKYVDKWLLKSPSTLADPYIKNDTVGIADSAFYSNTTLSQISIPSNVLYICSSAFGGCSNLTSITIPAGVTSIGSAAFWGCTKLTSVTIPDGVTNIEGYTFYNCRGLTSVTIPAGVTSIGSEAFYDCRGLTSITIKAITPPTLSNINAFSNTNNCPIYVPAESVAAYQTATNWSSLSNPIQAIPT